MPCTGLRSLLLPPLLVSLAACTGVPDGITPVGDFQLAKAKELGFDTSRLIWVSQERPDACAVEDAA